MYLVIIVHHVAIDVVKCPFIIVSCLRLHPVGLLAAVCLPQVVVAVAATLLGRGSLSVITASYRRTVRIVANSDHQAVPRHNPLPKLSECIRQSISFACIKTRSRHANLCQRTVHRQQLRLRCPFRKSPRKTVKRRGLAEKFSI